MVWSEQFVRNVGAEIYFGVHSYRSTVDDYGVFLHDFRSQFFVSQHIVGLVCPRYKHAFDTQILAQSNPPTDYQEQNQQSESWQHQSLT